MLSAGGEIMKTKAFDRFLKDPAAASCGCGDGCCGTPKSPADETQPKTGTSSVPLSPAKTPWIIGQTPGPAGDIPLVSTRLRFADRAGACRARWGVGRMSYSVPPGLYGFGHPDKFSPAFVTANYKMSFDRVRSALDGRDGWILVLDTRGINVWCAAGKGTFGTEELVRRLGETGLAGVVSHRTLILPQLGAPGITAHEISKQTKFRVVYGPVRAEDLPAFLDAGSRADPAMRKVRFGFRDRLVLTPVEIVGVITHRAFLAALALWIIGLAGVDFLRFDFLAVLGAVFIGGVLVPAFLPWIPGRAFSFKGWILGAVWAAVIFFLRGGPPASAGGWAGALSLWLILPALSAFLAMNFTGSSPITSLSGVVKEMRTAVPLILLSTVLGAVSLVLSMILKA